MWLFNFLLFLTLLIGVGYMLISFSFVYILLDILFIVKAVVKYVCPDKELCRTLIVNHASFLSIKKKKIFMQRCLHVVLEELVDFQSNHWLAWLIVWIIHKKGKTEFTNFLRGIIDTSGFQWVYYKDIIYKHEVFVHFSSNLIIETWLSFSPFFFVVGTEPRYTLTSELHP